MEREFFGCDQERFELGRAISPSNGFEYGVFDREKQGCICLCDSKEMAELILSLVKTQINCNYIMSI